MDSFIRICSGWSRKVYARRLSGWLSQIRKAEQKSLEKSSTSNQAMSHTFKFEPGPAFRTHGHAVSDAQITAKKIPEARTIVVETMHTPMAVDHQQDFDAKVLGPFYRIKEDKLPTNKHGRSLQIRFRTSHPLGFHKRQAHQKYRVQ